MLGDFIFYLRDVPLTVLRARAPPARGPELRCDSECLANLEILILHLPEVNSKNNKRK